MRNQFVYDACGKLQVAEPDIDVNAQRCYAQCAEDLIVVSMLRACASVEGLDLARERYLEIGANHPIATSATYLLHLNLGMTGVLVEANPRLIDTLRRVRSKDDVVHTAIALTDEPHVDFFCSNQSELSSLSRRFVEEWRAGAVGLRDVIKVPAMRMNELLERHFGDRPPLYLSIDIEGLDLEILQDIDWERWRPAIVQAEPSDHFVSENSDGMIQFMHQQGYRLACRTDVNLIFADSFRSAESIELPAISHHSDSPRQSHDVSTVSVGIVMRTQNRPQLLRRALESVKQQSFANWKLVVVNDAGDPAPVDRLVAQVFAQDPRVHILHRTQSSGMEAASNAGLSTLNTDLAIIHDDDDSWAPEFLSIMTAVLKKQQKKMPTVRGIVCRPNAVWESVVANHIEVERVEPWHASQFDRLTEGLLPIERLLTRNQFPPIAFLFSLPDACSLGLFDETLPVLGDWDFHLRFAQRHDIWVHAEYLAFYHLRAASTGALANTVIDGRGKHDLYRRLVRNKYVREHDGSPILLAMQMELRESLLSLNQKAADQEAMLRACYPLWRTLLAKARNFARRILT